MSIGRFSTYEIVDQTKNRAVQLLCCFFDMNQRFVQMHLIFTGSVAVGKTYVQNKVQEFLNLNDKEYTLYPEFIHEDPVGLKLLSMRFENLISASTLQNYVIDKWFLIAEQNKNKHSAISLYERLPEEAVEVFSKLFVSSKELAVHRARIAEVPLPKYKDMNSKNCLWIKFVNDIYVNKINKLLEVIAKYLYSYEYIVIEVLSKTAYDNFKKRSREGENYSFEDLMDLSTEYDKYTQKLTNQILPFIINI